MSSKRVLVIGANRGIGLNLIKTFILRGWVAYGSIRPQTRGDPSVKDLEDTGATIFEIDYTNESTIIEAAKAYGTGALDCLVNCGGLGPQPFDWDADKPERLREMFDVMAVGPYLATKHFLPNLKQSTEPGKIASISSDFGCITSNDRGGFLGYRMAKCALNQQTKTIAQSFKEGENKLIFVGLEPGYIATRLTGWKGDTDMETSVNGMVDVIENVKQEDSGLLISYTGAKVPF